MRFGPIEFARFGNHLLARSQASAEQSAAARTKMIAALPTIVEEIDALVSGIADQVARLPPDRLLHRAWWEFASLATGNRGKEALEYDLLGAMRMVDYIQSVVASVKPNEHQLDSVSEEDWAGLTEDTRTLFTRMSLEYQICQTASRRAADPNFDTELEAFRFQAETVWMNVRGKRYQPHECSRFVPV